MQILKYRNLTVYGPFDRHFFFDWMKHARKNYTTMKVRKRMISNDSVTISNLQKNLISEGRGKYAFCGGV